MQVTGKVLSGGIDFSTNKPTLTLEINESQEFKNEFEKIKEIEKLAIEVKKYRKKRSLDANAYSWALMTEIGMKMDPPISKEEVYDIMLKRYGTFLTDENGNHVVITIKKTVDLSILDFHLQHIKDNGEFSSYIVIKGSSEYDTLEMSKFIDGVVTECKDFGISTLTDTELNQMKERWSI